MTNEEAIAIEHEIMRILVVTEEHKERVFTAHKMAIEALERQTPEKPNVSNGFYRYYLCPACEHSLVAYTWEGGIHYCHCCGQAIDWSDADE